MPSILPALAQRRADTNFGALHQLWSADGRLLHTLRGHLFPITDARFDPCGARVVTSSEGSSRNAIVWRTATGGEEHVLIGHFGTVTAASFSSDGRWVLTAGPAAAGVWNVERGTLLFLLHGATDNLTDAEWSPSGYRVVTAERDGRVRTYRCGVCGPLKDLFALAQARLATAR
jgi:WD40 repeat protein